jgi:hypothetical protein
MMVWFFEDEYDDDEDENFMLLSYSSSYSSSSSVVYKLCRITTKADICSALKTISQLKESCSQSQQPKAKVQYEI